MSWYGNRLGNPSRAYPHAASLTARSSTTLTSQDAEARHNLAIAHPDDETLGPFHSRHTLWTCRLLSSSLCE